MRRGHAIRWISSKEAPVPDGTIAGGVGTAAADRADTFFMAKGGGGGSDCSAHAMAGSQLSQLKSSLRDSGLSRTSAPKDPKKRNKQRKQLSSGSQTHRSAKLDALGKEFNRFDVREENKKFEVVTRQGKVEEGRKGAPGKSRAAGIELVRHSLSCCFFLAGKGS